MLDLSSPRHRAFALLFVMPLFFSSNMVIGRAAVETVEPWTLAFLRWTLAFLILLPFAHRGLARHRGTLLRHWDLLGIMGLLGMWFCGAGVYFALRFTTATNGTLIYTSSPVLILMLEWLFRGRSISAREAVGIVLAILGVITIVVEGSLSALLSLRFNGGDVIFALAALSWAVYSVLLKRGEFTAVPTLSLFAALALTGTVSLFPFAIWEIAETGQFPVTSDAWVSIFGVAVVSSVLAFSCFQYGIKVVGPSVTGVFMYLLPPYGVLMAVVFLGEALHAYHFAGFLLVMSGLVLATAPPALVQRLSLRLLSRLKPQAR
ncbi:DMT family transporter [Stappia indica]|uniref:DMT family transporter n=1 Tax=Stappia indica TaxID=538381 RepID=UPI001CD2DA64|nr:DMT family transporter [Stappia indica]MCA1297052.1 DMT family transporter [Stappia indica]